MAGTLEPEELASVDPMEIVAPLSGWEDHPDVLVAEREALLAPHSEASGSPRRAGLWSAALAFGGGVVEWLRDTFRHL